MGYQESYDAGKAALKAGRADEAIRLLTECTQLSPGEAEAWLFLGVAQAQAGQDAAGEHSLRHATELNPQDARACYNLGRLLQRIGNTAGARESYARALAIAPTYDKARSALAEVGGAPPPPRAEAARPPAPRPAAKTESEAFAPWETPPSATAAPAGGPVEQPVSGPTRMKCYLDRLNLGALIKVQFALFVLGMLVQLPFKMLSASFLGNLASGAASKAGAMPTMPPGMPAMPPGMPPMPGMPGGMPGHMPGGMPAHMPGASPFGGGMPGMGMAASPVGEFVLYLILAVIFLPATLALFGAAFNYCSNRFGAPWAKVRDLRDALVVERIDGWSVSKVAGATYAMVYLIIGVPVVLLTGILGMLAGKGGAAVGALVGGFIGLAVAVVILGVLVAVFTEIAVGFYNLAALIVGGAQIRVERSYGEWEWRSFVFLPSFLCMLVCYLPLAVLLGLGCWGFIHYMLGMLAKAPAFAMMAGNPLVNLGIGPLILAVILACVIFGVVFKILLYNLVGMTVGGYRGTVSEE